MAASIPKAMKAVQLLKVRVWEGVYKSPTPIIPSHEPVGTVVLVGSKAIGKWKIGLRVGINLFQHQCHSCVPCETINDIRFCENRSLAGLVSDGGMAEYMVSDAESVVLLPDSLSFEQAAPLMCASATVWGGIHAANVNAPEPIGIVGSGSLGSLAVQFAKALGHCVVAIDDRPEGMALAQELTLKADLVIDFNDGKAADKIESWAGKGGLSAIIVCTDDIPAILWSTKALRVQRVVINIGLPTKSIPFDAFDVGFQDKTVKGSLVATVAQVEDMLKVVDEFEIRSHITTVPLEKSPDLPDMYLNPHPKGRLVMKLSS